MICAYQDQWREVNSTITFDSITVEYPSSRHRDTNSLRNSSAYEAGSMLDLKTGTFTSPIRGYYRVTFSGGADIHPGKVANLCFWNLTTTFVIHRTLVEETHWLTCNHLYPHLLSLPSSQLSSSMSQSVLPHTHFKDCHFHHYHNYPHQNHRSLFICTIATFSLI